MAAAFSQQLRQIHQQLRDQLSRIQDDLGGEECPETGLQVRCLAFCSALATHHVGEDDDVFPRLVTARPGLAPTVRKLIGDHTAIAAILPQIRALVRRASTAPAEDLPGLRREFDGLAAIMESHFRYEERTISAALDEDAPAGGWPASVFTADGMQAP